MIKIAPETALRLTLNDRIKQIVAKDHLARITPLERMACGGLAGASAQVHGTLIVKCTGTPERVTSEVKILPCHLLYPKCHAQVHALRL